MIIIDRSEARIPRKAPTVDEVRFDRQVLLILCLMIAVREPESALNAYLDLLEHRATLGARQGDA